MASPPAERFTSRPHRTFLLLAAPILVSLIAEPLVGLADTAFVAKLGAAPTAALGVATALLSGVFWVFNFLGIATQSEIANAHGAGDVAAAGAAKGQALALSLVFGVSLAVILWPAAEIAARAMGADAEMIDGSVTYLRIRLFAAPAVLLTLAGFGLLRGMQDMRTPLIIAVCVNVINFILDPVLIFGLFGLPRMELAGAAWASTVSQWLGAVFAVVAAYRRCPGPSRLEWSGVVRLLNVGWNLFLRTGLLMIFLLVATRAATSLGVRQGAAHQVMRQVWLLSAFALDAYAGAAQSLVAYFRGAQDWLAARRVATIACGWAVFSGVLLAMGLGLSRSWLAAALVPETARPLFDQAWFWVAICQPVNAISFVTDGLHWATMDYVFLRNAMLSASVVAVVVLGQQSTLSGIWGSIALWITIRAALGIFRIWPGIGQTPWIVRYD